MADIFISYKREDRQIAERLSIALEQLGFDVWWDFELLSGQQFRRVIEQVIDQCHVAVVLWSALSRDSTFVVDEATYAREQNKLCPARIDDCRLPLGFGGDHVVDLKGWDGEMNHDGLQGLLRAIEEKTGKKARLGARPRTQTEEARFAEMEAFKAAQAAQNVPALRTFLRDYSEGVFATFVRGQLQEMPADAPSPGPAQPSPAGTNGSGPKNDTKRLPWPLIAGGGALAALIAAALIFHPWRAGQASTEFPVEPEATMAASPHAAAAFNVDALDPNVRAAAIEARAAQVRANNAAESARDAAARAKASSVDCGAISIGDCTYAFAGDHAGDIYAGHRDSDGWQGYGVLSYGENANNVVGSLRYEGEFAANKLNGFGDLWNRDGARYAGQFRDTVESGYGVLVSSDGSYYEGAVSDNRYEGYGVLWSSDGLAWSAGVWSAGVLTTPLGAQGTAPAASADFKR